MPRQSNKQSRHFGFTFNASPDGKFDGWGDQYDDQWKNNDKIKYLVYAREIGLNTKNYHLQGHVQFKERQRIVSALKILGFDKKDNIVRGEDAKVQNPWPFLAPKLDTVVDRMVVENSINYPKNTLQKYKKHPGILAELRENLEDRDLNLHFEIGKYELDFQACLRSISYDICHKKIRSLKVIQKLHPSLCVQYGRRFQHSLEIAQLPDQPYIDLEPECEKKLEFWYGVPGTGKSEAAMLEGNYDPKNYFMVGGPTFQSDNFWANGYNYQKLLIIDEFRNKVDYMYSASDTLMARIKVIANDNNMKLNIKHGQSQVNWDRIIFTSNVCPLEWGIDGVSWDAIISRVTKVVFFSFPPGFRPEDYKRRERYKYAIKEEQRFFRNSHGEWTLVPEHKFEELTRKKRMKKKYNIQDAFGRGGPGGP